MPRIVKTKIVDNKAWITVRDVKDYLIIHVVGPVEEVSLKDDTLVIKAW